MNMPYARDHVFYPQYHLPCFNLSVRVRAVVFPEHVQGGEGSCRRDAGAERLIGDGIQTAIVDAGAVKLRL